MADIRIPQMGAGTLAGDSLFETAQYDESSVTSYSTTKVSGDDIAEYVSETKTYNALNTTAKNLVGAINELEAGGGGGGSSTLAGLSDVDITSPTDGQALVYDAVNQEWVNGAGGGGSSTLAGLTDVDITTPTDGQVLSYDSVNQEWVNADVGDASKVELTQAEYDALEQAGTLDPTVLYFITDGQSGNEIIDDSTTSQSKVWSSDKTNTEIQTVASDLSGLINDSSTSATKVWSANKVNSELSNCGKVSVGSWTTSRSITTRVHVFAGINDVFYVIWLAGSNDIWVRNPSANTVAHAANSTTLDTITFSRSGSTVTVTTTSQASISLLAL